MLVMIVVITRRVYYCSSSLASDTFCAVSWVRRWGLLLLSPGWGDSGSEGSGTWPRTLEKRPALLISRPLLSPTYHATLSMKWSWRFCKGSWGIQEKVMLGWEHWRPEKGLGVLSATSSAPHYSVLLQNTGVQEVGRESLAEIILQTPCLAIRNSFLLRLPWGGSIILVLSPR